MNKQILLTALFFGCLAVILGAFATHGLKELISFNAQQTFETAVRYQMYHALLLLFVGTSSVFSLKTKRVVYYVLVIGLILFSGSIYGLATNELTTFNFKSIAFITPIGGSLLIVSWALLFISILRNKVD